MGLPVPTNEELIALVRSGPIFKCSILRRSETPSFVIKAYEDLNSNEARLLPLFNEALGSGDGECFMCSSVVDTDDPGAIVLIEPKNDEAPGYLFVFLCDCDSQKTSLEISQAIADYFGGSSRVFDYVHPEHKA